MCLPMLSILGSVIGAIGSLASASAQAQSQRMQADLQIRQANLEREQNSYQGQRMTEQGRQFLARQTAGFASNGIAPNAGSARAVTESTGQDIALDVAAVRYGASEQEVNRRFSADIYRQNANATMTAGFFNALTPIIGGVGTYLQGSFS